MTALRCQCATSRCARDQSLLDVAQRVMESALRHDGRADVEALRRWLDELERERTVCPGCREAA